MKIEEFLSHPGQVARTQSLLRKGFSAQEIRYAAELGKILKIRKGWYGSRTLPQDLIQAVRVGGRLCGPSAAKYHGLWVPPFDGIHISVPNFSSRLRSPMHSKRPLASIQKKHPDAVKLYWD